LGPFFAFQVYVAHVALNHAGGRTSRMQAVMSEHNISLLKQAAFPVDTFDTFSAWPK
jgi:hypothetical protein